MRPLKSGETGGQEKQPSMRPTHISTVDEGMDTKMATTHDKMIKRLYTVPEASVYLGRTVCAVREMIWAGKLSAVKCDRRTMLDVIELDQHIESNKILYTD